MYKYIDADMHAYGWKTTAHYVAWDIFVSRLIIADSKMDIFKNNYIYIAVHNEVVSWFHFMVHGFTLVTFKKAHVLLFSI